MGAAKLNVKFSPVCCVPKLQKAYRIRLDREIETQDHVHLEPDGKGTAECNHWTVEVWSGAAAFRLSFPTTGKPSTDEGKGTQICKRGAVPCSCQLREFGVWVGLTMLWSPPERSHVDLGY